MKKKESMITLAVCIGFLSIACFGSEITKIKATTPSQNTHSEGVDTKEAKNTNSKNTKNSTDKNNSRVNNTEANSVNTKNNQDNDNGKNNKTSTSISSNEENNTSKNQNSNTGGFKDGEYIGEAQGFKGIVKVKVSVSNGKISDVEVIETTDDYDYFQKAEEITSHMVEKNSTDVAVVSGATFSSNGIINAAKNALSKASQ